MRVFRRINSTLGLRRRRRFLADQLIDVSEEAHLHGISEHVFVTERLWTGLLNSYPFAEAGDFLAIDTIFHELKRLLHTARAPNVQTLSISPAQLPIWFPRACCLKVIVSPPRARRRSIIIQPEADSFRRSIAPKRPTLPATLLVRLAHALRDLLRVSQTAEQGVLIAMQELTRQLTEANPFYREIFGHFDVLTPINSPDGPADHTRTNLLIDLDQLMGTLSECTAKGTLPEIETFRSHYRALLSPLAEFSRMLEDLLRFSAIVGGQNASFHTANFSPLLALYSDLSARLLRLETKVPNDALDTVRTRIRALAVTIAHPNPEFFSNLEHCFSSLVQNPALAATGILNDVRQALTWH